MMKVEIGQILSNFNGQPIVGPDNNPVTVGAVLLDHCGLYINQADGKKMIMANSLGERIYACKNGELELETAELEFLREVIQPPRYGARVMAQVMEALGIE